MKTTYTVVAWINGARHPRTVGPTSEDASLLRPVRTAARAKYDDAEIVTWGRRNLTVHAILAARAKREALAAAIA